MGTNQLIGKQIMANKLEEQFFVPLPIGNDGYMYSATGQELAYSTSAVIRIVPATWSHDNTRVATINASHQLVVIDLQGKIQPIGQLNDDQEWLYSEITWSDDDRFIDVDGKAWVVP